MGYRGRLHAKAPHNTRASRAAHPRAWEPTQHSTAAFQPEHRAPPSPPAVSCVPGEGRTAAKAQPRADQVHCKCFTLRGCRTGSAAAQTWVQIPTLLFTSCAASGKLHGLPSSGVTYVGKAQGVPPCRNYTGASLHLIFFTKPQQKPAR